MASNILYQSNNKQEELEKRGDDIKNIIQASFFDMKSISNKESLVSEMLFNMFVSNTGKVLNEKRKKRAKERVEKCFKNNGCEPRENKTVDSLISDALTNEEDHRFEDFDVILSGENGEDELRLLYLNEIKKSEVFQQIMKATNQQELEAAINNAKEESKKGITSFEAVTLPNVAEPYNVKAHSKYVKRQHSLNYSLNIYLLESDWKEEKEAYILRDFNPQTLKKNAEVIEELKNSLNNESYSKLNGKFAELKKGLAELSDMATKYASQGRPLSMHESTEYKKKVLQVSDLADDYLDSPDQFNVSADKSHLNAILNVKKILAFNINDHGKPDVQGLPDEKTINAIAEKLKNKRLHKRQQEYRGLSDKIEIVEDDPFQEEKENVLKQVKILNDKLAVLSPYDENGKVKNEETLTRKLSMEDIDELIKLYQNSLNKMHKLTTAINEDIDETEERIRISQNTYLAASMMNEVKVNNATVATYDNIARTMSKDLRALMKARKRGKEVSLDTIFENSRVNSQYKVAGEVQPSSKGAQNERIPLTIVGNDGQPLKGYFTPDCKIKVGTGNIVNVINQAKRKYGSSANHLTYENIMSLYSKFVLKNDAAVRYLLAVPEKISMIGYNGAVAILSKNMGSSIKPFINTPAKLNMFIDVAGKAFRMKNQLNISSGIGINDKARVNRRNAAMSKIAELLGCDDTVAYSENIRIKINGRYVKGTFMKEALGEDINKVDKNCKMLRSSIKGGMYLGLKKQIASLQIVDYLAGNPDRHGGNMLYQFEDDINGTSYMKSFTGIDNDSMGGANDYDNIKMSAVKLENMKVIPEDVANRIMNLDAETLKQMLYGFDMTTREINNVVSRLTRLQDKIKTDKKQYEKGYTEGYIIPKTIKTVSDKELEELPYEELTTKAKNKQNLNLFDRVGNVFKASKNVDMYSDYTTHKYCKAVYNYTVNSVEAMSSLIASLNKDTSFGHSSGAYDAMHAAMKNLNAKMCGFTGPIYGNHELTQNGHAPSLMELREQIRQTLSKVNDYIYYKNNKKSGEEWRDIEGPHEMSTTEKRYHDAIKCREFLTHQLEKFDELQQSLDEYNEMNRNYDKQSEDANRIEVNALNDEEYLTYLSKHEEKIYKNHISRTLYDIKKAYDDMQKSNVKFKAYYTMKYEMLLGYGINAIKPEDQQSIKQELEDYTKTKITLSNEEMHKRAVACDIIITKAGLNDKVNAAKNSPKKKLDANTKELYETLKDVEVVPMDTALNRLLNNNSFNSFYNKNQNLMKIKDPYKVPGVASPTDAQMKKMAKALNQEMNPVNLAK